jgi:CPA2 family monovalent cation:H+ antiporter-2
VVCAALPLAFGYPGRAAIFAGLTLAQIGEFSFVLAQLGLDRGIISDYLYSLTLTAALGTILLAPTLLTLAPATTKALQSLPGLGRLFAERAVVYGEKEMAQLTQHVVIAGFGRVGRELADALERRGFKYAVIDYNPHVVEEAKRRNIPAVYGDAANEAVLAHVNLPKARVLAITLPEPAVAEVAIRNARRINSRLDIIVRAHSVLELQRMRQTGATEVVHPEFEAGLEFIRHTLHRFGVSRTEIQAFLNGRREGYYG